MKIVILDYDYPRFLEKYHAARPFRRELSFEAERADLMRERFGTFDSYSHHLKQLGHEAEEIVTNDARTQLQWARENGLFVPAWPTLISNACNYLFGLDWRFKIVREQIKKIRPDVVLVQEQSLFTDAMIGELKKFTRLMACQIASPLLKRRNYRTMDIVITSFPHFVPLFKQRGIPAEYVPLAFDQRIFYETGKVDKQFDISFVGGVSPAHKSRWQLLEKVSEKYPLAWFGYGVESLPRQSALRRAWRGEVWGRQMYRTLAASKLTLNCHIDAAEGYANNSRLFEATGVGTCLVTDWKKNLNDFFVEGKEVVTYRDSQELMEKIDYYLDHPEESRQIAQRGCEKTIGHHNYEIMMERLSRIFENHLFHKTRSH